MTRKGPFPFRNYSDLLRGAEGRPVRLVSGVLRNTGSAGGYWQPRDEAGYKPTNIDSVTTATSTITVDFSSLKATRVLYCAVEPDEILSRQGYSAGAAPTLTQAVITLGRAQTIADLVSYNGTTWTSGLGVFTPTFTTGKLRLTHPYMGGVSVALSGRGGTYLPQITPDAGAILDTELNVHFYDFAGVKVDTPDANMRVYVSRSHAGGLNPQDTDTTRHPSSELFFSALVEVAA